MEVPLGRRFLPLGSPASAGLFYSRPLSSLSERQRWKQPAFCPSLNGKTARLRRGIVPFTHLAREGRMTVTLGRRELLAALGGAAVAWPLVARAQQPQRVRRIGVFMPGVADDPEFQAFNAAFLQRLAELGWIVGRNVRIDYRWGAGDAERYRAIAASSVALAP